MSIFKIYREGIFASGRGHSRSARRRATKGSATVFAAVSLPPLIILGFLGVDQSYVSGRNLLLKRTVQSAAIAAANQLNTTYAGTASANAAEIAAIAATAQASAALNMPPAQYGSVIPSSNVVLGTWNGSTFTASNSNANAVKITGINTVANSNPVNTFFGGLLGKATVDMSTSAVSSYGSGAGAVGLAVNTIVVNDLSMSFSSEIPNQRAVDIAILNCIAAASNGSAQVGLTTFTGHSQATYPITAATVANMNAIRTFINGSLNYCGNAGMPACSGSNIAAGMYSAITQLQAAGLANKTSNIIVVTDGVPNANATTYAAADGTKTPTGVVNAKSITTAVCSTGCTDANLWTMAGNQAAYAGAQGINVSTVYYSGSTTGSTGGVLNQTLYANNLASLISGTGKALVAPNPASISSAANQTFCAQLGTGVKQVL